MDLPRVRRCRPRPRWTGPKLGFQCARKCTKILSFFSSVLFQASLLSHPVQSLCTRSFPVCPLLFHPVHTRVHPACTLCLHFPFQCAVCTKCNCLAIKCAQHGGSPVHTWPQGAIMSILSHTPQCAPPSPPIIAADVKEAGPAAGPTTVTPPNLPESPHSSSGGHVLPGSPSRDAPAQAGHRARCFLFRRRAARLAPAAAPAAAARSSSVRGRKAAMARDAL